jgi:arylsulfatase A-like enzyme
MQRALALVVVCVSWLPGVAQAQPAGPTRPNVVLIITDDVGYGDIGSYGAPDIRTPNIDSLARDGVKLTDFYANAATCTPTRVGLLTGRYQQRYALENPLGNVGLVGDQGLTATGRSLAQLLKTHGYATGLVGKWHVGYQTRHSPNAHGFDYFFGFKSGFIDYYTHTAGDGLPDLWENETPIERDGYMTDLITTEAVGFIETHADRAFFLDVSYNAAHWPYQVPDMPSKAVGNARHLQPHDADTGTRADYVAMLERADQGVGEILRALDRQGLAGNTLVIFTNDNGGEWLSRNAPLFHRKQTLWEGGIRVPALLRWPGRIPAGTVSGQVGITMDLTASILAATQSPVPADARLEGMDLLPMLSGKAADVERTLFWRTTGQGPQRAVRRGDWKLLVDAGKVLLFDVRADLGERNDLAGQRQDIARELRPLVAAWEADVDAEAEEAGLRAPGRGGRGAGRGGRGAGRGQAPQ